MVYGILSLFKGIQAHVQRVTELSGPLYGGSAVGKAHFGRDAAVHTLILSPSWLIVRLLPSKLHGSCDPCEWISLADDISQVIGPTFF